MLFERATKCSRTHRSQITGEPLNPHPNPHPKTFTLLACRVIYHDALSTWWSGLGQKHMEKLRFKHRQIRSIGNTNINNRYKGCLPGDSPELMPLDNNLFADFSKALLANCCATRHLPKNNVNKFSVADPKTTWSAMLRTWQHSPSSERIVEDIERWPKSIAQVPSHTQSNIYPPPPLLTTHCIFCEQIVKNEGTAVDWEKIRRGIRKQAHVDQRALNRWSKARRDVKKGDVAKMPLHPTARTEYYNFLDLTTGE